MSLITVNGAGVLSGTIMMPLSGLWIAQLVIDQPNGDGFSAGTACDIVAADGITLHGTVIPDRTGSFLDSVHVRIIGGAGGMGKAATPQGYTQPGAYVRDVLGGLMKDSGESLSSTIDSALLARNLIAWNTVQNSVSRNLSALLNIVEPNASWRILADGTLWIGVDTWPSTTPVYDLLVNNPGEATIEIGLDSPSIYPGVTVDGIGKINRIEHQIEGDRIRARIWTEAGTEDRGIRASISAMVRQELAHIDYFAMYDAKVISQSSDLTTVDLSPLDSRIPGMSKVPLRHGLPGTKVQIDPGAIIRLGWDRANPSLPFAALWNGGETVQSIQLAGNIRVARLDDPTDMGTWQLSGIGSSFAGIQWTPPGGGSPVLITNTSSTALTGSISGASSVLRCG